MIVLKTWGYGDLLFFHAEISIRRCGDECRIMHCSHVDGNIWTAVIELWTPCYTDLLTPETQVWFAFRKYNKIVGTLTEQSTKAGIDMGKFYPGTRKDRCLGARLRAELVAEVVAPTCVSESHERCAHQ